MCGIAWMAYWSPATLCPRDIGASLNREFQARRVADSEAFGFELHGITGRVHAYLSTLATMHGEALYLRIQSSGNRPLDLDEQGYEPDTCRLLEGVMEHPQGLVIVSGARDSGKTTTLYTLLGLVDSHRRKVVSVEAPVEDLLPRVLQVAVNPADGESMADGVRAALRHNPDVLMIGSLSDNETVELALRAAAHGTLVLAALDEDLSFRSLGRVDRPRSAAAHAGPNPASPSWPRPWFAAFAPIARNPDRRRRRSWTGCGPAWMRRP